MTTSTVNRAAQPLCRPVLAEDLAEHGRAKLEQACRAIAYHLPDGSTLLTREAFVDRAFLADALSDIAGTTPVNLTRSADEMIELSEALHALRNSVVRHHVGLGSRRFSVLIELVDVLFFASADDPVIDWLAFVAYECLYLRELPQLFLLSRALSDVKTFTHGKVKTVGGGQNV